VMLVNLDTTHLETQQAYALLVLQECFPMLVNLQHAKIALQEPTQAQLVFLFVHHVELGQ
jgi:hypothetical protein